MFRRNLCIAIICLLAVLSGVVAYAAEIVENGAKNQSFYMVMEDRNGDPNTSITVTTLDMYYVEDRLAGAAKADCSDLGSENAAHTDGGAYEIGTSGLYRFDFPDEAFDGGIGKRVTLWIDDAITGTRTAFLTVMLSPPMDVNSISRDVTASDNFEDLWDEAGIAANQKEIWVTDHATNYDGTLNVWNVDSEFFDGNDVTVDNVHEFFGKTSSVGAYENFEDFFDNTGLSVATFTTDGMTQANIETYSQTGANAALVAMNLDHLLFLTTGVAADGDLEAFVSSGTVMAHLMGIAADVTEYDATVDSLEALGAHADTIETDTAALAYLVEDTGQTTDQDLEAYVEAGSILAHLMGEAADVTVYKASTDAMSLGAASAASVADAVWDELSTGHVSAGKAGTQLWTDVDAIIIDTAVIGALGAGLTAVPWNSDWDAQVESEVEDAVGSDVTSILTYTGTTIPAILGNETYGLSALESLVDDIGVAGAGLTAIEVEATMPYSMDSQQTIRQKAR